MLPDGVATISGKDMPSYISGASPGFLPNENGDAISGAAVLGCLPARVRGQRRTDD
jgi:hypothetical protein